MVKKKKAFSEEDKDGFVREVVRTIEGDQARKPSGDWFYNEHGGVESRLWNLVRYCKGFFHSDDGYTESAFSRLDEVVTAHFGTWEAAYGVDSEAAYYEFLDTWPKIRFDATRTPLQLAWEKAKKMPVQTPHSQEVHRRRRYDQFISLAGWLQHIRGESPIYLPCAAVAELMGTDKRMVSTWRRLAEREGYLQVLKGPRFIKGGRGEATEYRFTKVDFFNDLAQRQPA